MQQKRNQQAEIRLGSHGEDYGSWMSNPVFYIIGGITALAVVLAILSFSVIHITALGVLFSVAAAALAALLVWITWIRRQYAFGGGGIMEQVHRVVLSHLDYDGQGSLLEVGCGSGALSIRAALTWPESKVTGMDYWGAVYNYSKALCEKNAASEGVASRCVFRHGDANHLDFPDESFDAVISNYVYHNVMGADMHKLLLESLRVLKKGGVLLNFDANYGITDFSNVEDLPENHAHNMLGNEMMRECEEIKRQLPISSYSRPAWDLETLGAMSLKEFHVDLGISSRIYLEKDEFYNPTPLFMLRTVK